MKETSSREGQFGEALYLANIIGLYIQEKAVRRQVKKRRKRNRDNNQTATDKSRGSLNDVYVDFLFPFSQGKEGLEREKAKRSFDNVLQLGQRWARLVESFGCGILLLIPDDLSNEE